jgi:hypothetical protein
VAIYDSQISTTPSIPVRKTKFSNILAQGEFSLALNLHVKTLIGAAINWETSALKR